VGTASDNGNHLVKLPEAIAQGGAPSSHSYRDLSLRRPYRPSRDARGGIFDAQRSGRGERMGSQDLFIRLAREQVR
jgi:hypothetical protein